ncbi:MAG TPA: hypothetical protein VK968_17125, partial [Roseimicrobium sp.]|nr:hypothetical protein [Roseimicrobium sp.]
MAPQFNLGFSGSGPNGLVGHGWSIQGYSTITRCGATRAADGKPSAVTYGAADKLCLDGQRLIQTNDSGAPSATQTNDALGQTGFLEFRTENDLYSRIRTYGMATAGKPEDGPAYIQVWTKSGQLFQYGAIPANPGALIRANPALDGKTAAMVWAISRVNDAVGNYMEFHYAVRSFAWGSGTSGNTTGQEWYLTEVLYTGTQNGARTSAPDNKLAFVYADRPGRAGTPLGANPPQDRSETYHRGSKNFSVKRLSAIDTYVNVRSTALRVRRINLGYDNSVVTGRSRLITLEECFGNAALTCRPKTKFEYANAGDEALTLSSKFKNNDLSDKVKLLSTNGQYGVLTGDFDGDGRTDILRWAEDPTKNQLFVSKGEGGFLQMPKDPANPGDGVFKLPDQLFRTDGCYFSMVIDVNGDGLSDILRYGNSRDLNGDACGAPIGDISHVFINNYQGSGRGQFTAVKIDAKPFGGSSYATLVLKRTVSKASSSYLNPCPFIPQRSPTGVLPAAGCTQYKWTAGNSFYLMDVNGDGRMDILTAR